MNYDDFNQDKTNEDALTQEDLGQENLMSKDEKLRPMLNRLSLSLIIYMFSSQLIASASMRFLDKAASMLLAVILSLTILVLLQKDKSLKSIFSFKQKDFELRDIFFFLGLMSFSTVIFSELADILINAFNLKSIDVMQEVTGSLNLLMILYVIVLGPIIEEIIYRGYLLQNLRQYSKQAALILSSFIFAFMHINIEQSISVLGISFILNYVVIFYSWKAGLLLHFINNLNATVLSYLVMEKGLDNKLIQIYSLLLMILMAYSIFTLFKGRFGEIRENLKADHMDMSYRKKILFSLPMLILILLYLGQMALTQIYI
ncbi:MAG: type II CAAX endopeptidase family protein [Tissierellia bacterium]|nr:type II CAAX endopeptidase family protein [Tissierellia bacterium]